MSRFRFRAWIVAGAIILGALWAAVRTGYAETVSGCVERVTLEIGDAMEDSNFVERVALGVLWEFLVTSCFVE